MDTGGVMGEVSEPLRSPAGLDLLDEAARLAEANSLSERTRSLYAADWQRFSRWCATAGRSALPADEHTIRFYATSMAMTLDSHRKRGYKVSTIARHLASIGHVHVSEGYPSPVRHPSVEALMRGLRRQQGARPQQMRPLLLDDIRSIVSAIDCSTWPAGLAGIRDTFILLGGFASAMRRSEMAAMRQMDIRHEPTTGLLVHIPWSKGDQEGRGARIVMPYGQSPQTCPVCAYVRWQQAVEAAATSRAAVMRVVLSTPEWDHRVHICGMAHQMTSPEAPVLRIIRRGGHLDSGLTGDALHRGVQRRSTHVGITGDIGFHSLRAGFVTQARRNGADARAVRRQTRHSSDALIDLYDREHSPLVGNAVADLGL